MRVEQIFFVLFSLFVVETHSMSSLRLGNPSCPIYTCKTSSQNFVNNTCVYYTPTAQNPTYYASNCATIKLPYCQPPTDNNSTCASAIPIPPLNSWPGEKCSSSSDCSSHASKGCINGACVGGSTGDICSTNDDCNPGLRCSKGICQAQIPVGGIGCTNDYDCVNGAGCNIAKTSPDSICFPYFSIAQHLPVSSCTSINTSLLCNSGLCMENNGSYECMASVSSRTLPNMCQVDSDCISTRDDYFSNGQLTGTCYCGYNPFATSYCSIFLGDKPGLDYLSYFKQWLQSKFIDNCNTMRRFNTQCIKDWWTSKNYNQYMYYLLTYNYYPLIEKGESCVQSIFLPQWYAAKSAV